MRSLREHIAALAAEDPNRPILLDLDERGTIVRTTSRAALLRQLDEKASELKGHAEPLPLEGESTSDFLITCWAAWIAGRTVVPLDRTRDTADLRAYKIRAASAARGEALILFTSGTTARPKGARLTLENLRVNARDIGAWLRIGADDRLLVQLPLHHINSTTFCLSMLLAGGSIALPPRYSSSRFWEIAAQSGATLTSLVQTIIFDQLKERPSFERLKAGIRLNRIQIGSAPVVAAAVQEFMKAFSIPLYQGYGQTETALRVTGVPMDLPAAVYEKLVAENSIGTPMPWADVEVADADGLILREGQEGELIVKGAAVMRGYVGNEPAFRDGYFLTGDVGYWREVEGRRFFFLKGRSKEIIIKGGVNISPIAVENALLAISPDIDQAYAVGVDDLRYGEEIGAAIVWKEGADAKSAVRRLKLDLLAGTPHLSAYETPLYLATLQAYNLPKTATGKVQRVALKERVAGAFEPVHKLLASQEFEFLVIGPQSPFVEASHALYNHCWQSRRSGRLPDPSGASGPLTKTMAEYKKYLGEYLTLAAIDPGGKLAGQISFSYKENSITCVSICSATFKPKPVPEVARVPNIETVQKYISDGLDPVINFHTRLGATVVRLIPGGRPADKSALGYTVLLQYPQIKGDAFYGPVSNQLIQAVRTLARDAGAEVFALSRPGGLASYLSRA